mgnify:CR=1 FL=1
MQDIYQTLEDRFENKFGEEKAISQGKYYSKWLDDGIRVELHRERFLNDSEVILTAYHFDFFVSAMY